MLKTDSRAQWGHLGRLAIEENREDQENEVCVDVLDHQDPTPATALVQEGHFFSTK